MNHEDAEKKLPPKTEKSILEVNVAKKETAKAVSKKFQL